MYILLLILKIIGWVLLGLLGLVLFLLGLVLFYPICYKLEASYYGNPEAKGKVYWLGPLLTLHVWLEEQKPQWVLKLLCFRLKSSREEERPKKKKRKKKKKTATNKKKKEPAGLKKRETQIEKKDVPEKKARAEASKAEPPAEPVKPEIPVTVSVKAEESVPEAESGAEVRQSETEKIQFKPKEEEKIQLPVTMQSAEDDLNTETISEEDNKKSSGKLRKFRKKVKRLLRKIRKFPKKVKRKLRKLKKKCLKILKKGKKLITKIKKTYEFITLEENKLGAKAGIAGIKKILYHMRPRKWKGSVRFGTQDPCKTGQILGVLGMFYPMYGKHITIRPDFEQSCLEGECRLKGHFQLGVLGFHGIKLIMNKELKQLKSNFDAWKEEL